MDQRTEKRSLMVGHYIVGNKTALRTDRLAKARFFPKRKEAPNKGGLIFRKEVSDGLLRGKAKHSPQDLVENMVQHNCRSSTRCCRCFQ